MKKQATTHRGVQMIITPDGDGCFSGSFVVNNVPDVLYGATTHEVEMRFRRVIDKSFLGNTDVVQ